MVPRSLERAIMARSRTGEAISPGRRTVGAQKELREFVAAAKDRGDLDATLHRSWFDDTEDGECALRCETGIASERGLNGVVREGLDDDDFVTGQGACESCDIATPRLEERA